MCNMIICKRCNEREARPTGDFCLRCYQANRKGSETKQEKISRSNFIRDGICIVTTNRGFEYIVDYDDFLLVKNFIWSDNDHGYAHRFIGTYPKRKKIYLHRFIMPGVDNVDHKNRNKLDNRKENLRDGSNSINALNKDIDTSGTYSKVRGIHKMRDKWQIRIFSREKRVYLGTFDTIDEAKSKLKTYAIQNGLTEFYQTSM